MSPYRDAAAAYYRAGWAPLPLRGKGPPPDGWTGAAGAWPSFADVYAWAEGPEGELNVGLRLPKHVLGIDVDDYDGKHGGQTLAAHEARFGDLPPTWISSARELPSGIRFYQVPEGLAWPGQLEGGSVELIQYRHRYAVAWPSIHPKIGERYEWSQPDGTAIFGSNQLPNVDDLPLLPQAWVDGLTGGRRQDDIPKADLGDPQAAAWLGQHGAGRPCAALSRTLARYEAELAQPGASRHDTAMRATSRLARMVVEGHAGGLEAFGRIKAAFDHATAGEKRPGEWARLITGAVRIAAVDDVLDGDPCDAGPFGIVRPITSAPNARQPLEVASCSAGSSVGSSATAITSSTVSAPTLSLADAANTSVAVAASASQSPVEVVELPGHSWRGVDLAAALDRSDDDAPAVLHRADGRALFYLGRVNGLIGPSESGKSWVALEAVRQEIDAGHRPAYVDFEDTARGVARRLLRMGVDRDALLAQLLYVGPSEPPGPAALAAVLAELEEHAPRLVVVDGYNAAMVLGGLDPMSNADVTRFHQAVLQPLTRADRAVVYIDHTPKSKTDESNGGIGAQAKRAMTRGAAIRVDKKADFGPGTVGYLRLQVDKDPEGFVRDIADKARYVGEAVIRGGGEETVTVEIVEYDPEQARAAADNARHDETAAHIIEYLELHRGVGPLSRNAITAAVKGDNARVVEVLRELVEDGYVIRSIGPNRTQLHSLGRSWPPAFGSAQ